MSISLLYIKDHRDHGQGDYECNKDHKRPCFHYASGIMDVVRIINFRWFSVSNKSHRNHGQKHHRCNKDHKYPSFYYTSRIIEIMVRGIMNVIRIINVCAFTDHRDHSQWDNKCPYFQCAI